MAGSNDQPCASGVVGHLVYRMGDAARQPPADKNRQKKRGKPAARRHEEIGGRRRHDRRVWGWPDELGRMAEAVQFFKEQASRN